MSKTPDVAGLLRPDPVSGRVCIHRDEARAITTYVAELEAWEDADRLTDRNAELEAKVERLRKMLAELARAVDADLGPLDDPEKCLCDCELPETPVCSVCLARRVIVRLIDEARIKDNGIAEDVRR